MLIVRISLSTKSGSGPLFQTYYFFYFSYQRCNLWYLEIKNIHHPSPIQYLKKKSYKPNIDWYSLKKELHNYNVLGIFQSLINSTNAYHYRIRSKTWYLSIQKWLTWNLDDSRVKQRCFLMANVKIMIKMSAEIKKWEFNLIYK